MNHPNLYISRAFVEFGPFSESELIDFQKRGVLRDIDHVRYHGEDDWIEVTGWMSSVGTRPTAAPPAAAKKSVKKAAPAKKAAAKKAAPAKKAAAKKTSTKGK